MSTSFSAAHEVKAFSLLNLSYKLGSERVSHLLENIILVNSHCENSLQISHIKTVSYTFEVQRDGEGESVYTYSVEERVGLSTQTV